MGRKYLPSLIMGPVITLFTNWKYKDSSRVPASNTQTPGLAQYHLE